MQTRPTAWTLAIVAVAFGPLASHADEPSSRSGERDAGAAPEPSQAARVIAFDTLPDPPPELAGWIDRGRVRFITGGRPRSDAASLTMRGRLAGETRFRFRYRYDSRARWRLLPENGQEPASDRQVQLNVRFRTLEWITEHDIWLRDPPAANDFWNDAVVRHEFDHVRLSASPQIEDRFLRAVKRLHSIRVPFEQVASNGRIDEAKIQSLVESRVNDAVQQTSEYARIRYRELDRLTEHGLRPLPAGATLIGRE
jgi:hypothetical protein